MVGFFTRGTGPSLLMEKTNQVVHCFLLLTILVSVDATPCEFLSHVYRDSLLVHPGTIQLGLQSLYVLGAGPMNGENASVAMYIDPRGARQDLARGRGTSALELRLSGDARTTRKKRFTGFSFFDSLSHSSASRAISITPVTFISTDHLAQTLKIGLYPRLSPQDARIQAQIFARFSDLLDQTIPDGLDEGDTLVIGIKDTGEFSFALNGNEGSSISEPLLDEAFWSMFADPANTFAPEATERFADRVPTLWTLEPDASAELREGEDFLGMPDTVAVRSNSEGDHEIDEFTLQMTGLSPDPTKSMIVSLYLDDAYLKSLTPDDMADWKGFAESLGEATSLPRVMRVQLQDEEMLSMFFLNPLLEEVLPRLDLDQEGRDNLAVQLRNLMPFSFFPENVIYLSCTEGDRLTIHLKTIGNPDALGHVESPGLCNAVMSAYLNEHGLLGPHFADLVSSVDPSLPSWPTHSSDTDGFNDDDLEVLEYALAGAGLIAAAVVVTVYQRRATEEDLEETHATPEPSPLHVSPTVVAKAKADDSSRVPNPDVVEYLKQLETLLELEAMAGDVQTFDRGGLWEVTLLKNMYGSDTKHAEAPVQYQIQCLREVCGLPNQEAQDIVTHAHLYSGGAAVGEFPFEIAEMYVETLTKKGLVVTTKQA